MLLPLYAHPGYSKAKREISQRLCQQPMKTIKPRRVDELLAQFIEKRGILVFMTYSFDTQVAERFGVNEAILIQNLVYWISKNEANGRHEHDGRYWTYNSAEAFAKLFPFWSVNQVRRMLAKLVDIGVLVKGNYNQVQYDRTMWYGFDDNFLTDGKIDFSKLQDGCCDSVKSILQNRKMEVADLTNDNNIIDEIPNSNTDIKPNENSIYPAAPKKPVVRQTSEKLCLFEDSKFADFEDFKKMFDGPEYEQIDLYYYHQVIMDWSASKGAKKRDWIATARNWMRTDKEKNKLHLIDTGMSDAFVAHFEQMAELFGN